MKQILQSNSSNVAVIIATCQLIRAQLREDNCSGDFSNAGERSRLLGCDLLEPLLQLLNGGCTILFYNTVYYLCLSILIFP